MSLTQALLAAHDVLETARLPHALCGGLAANLYREEVRATMDVDLAIAAGPVQVVDLVDRFREAGWEVEPFARRGEQLRLSHPDFPRVDCIVATTNYERSAIERAVTTEIEGRRIRVLTPEDLIVYKLMAGRARDYEAVAAIINARSLDVPYITGWLEQLDIPDAWERALAEAEREADR